MQKHSEAQTNHAALPFAIGSGGYNERNNKYDVVITSEARDVCTMELHYDDADANAAYIVQACNSYNALTEALQRIAEYAEACQFPGGECDNAFKAIEQDARNALALAEAHA